MAYFSGLKIAEVVKKTAKRKEAGTFDPDAIARGKQKPAIVIEDFDPTPSDKGGPLNPNSYNLRLGKHIKFPSVALHPLPAGERIIINAGSILDTDRHHYIDTAEPVDMESYEITVDGVALFPGHLYIGTTQEWTEAYGVVPCIEGRSSIARVGVSPHQAGWGDCGFCGRWTLEIQVVYPIILYAGMELCQISFSPVIGVYRPYQSKKYQGQTGPTESKIHKERHKWLRKTPRI